MSRAAGYRSQKRRAYERRPRSYSDTENNNGERADEQESEEEESGNSEDRGVLEVLSRLPGLSKGDESGLVRQLKPLVTQQHLNLWRESHVLLGFGEGHLEILLDVLTMGVRKTVENQIDAEYILPCLEVMCKVMALCHHHYGADIDIDDRNLSDGKVAVDGFANSPFSLTAEKKEQKALMIMDFFWGNADRVNLLIDVLFTISNKDSHLRVTYIISFLIGGRRVYFDKFCSLGFSFAHKVSDDMEGYTKFLSKRTGVSPSAFRSLTLLLMHLLKSQRKKQASNFSTVEEDEHRQIKWSPKSALSMLTLLCKVSSLVKDGLDDGLRYVKNMQRPLLNVLLECTHDSTIAMTQKINILICSILRSQRISIDAHSLLKELILAIQSKLLSDDVGLCEQMKFPIVREILGIHDVEGFYRQSLEDSILKKVTMDTYFILTPLAVMPADRESALHNVSLPKLCRCIANMKDVMDKFKDKIWNMENVHEIKHTERPDTLLHLQRLSMLHKDDCERWTKACFSSSSMNDNDDDNQHIFNTSDECDTPVVDNLYHVDVDGQVTSNKYHEGFSSTEDDMKKTLLEQMEKDCHLVNMCKTLDSWTSMMLHAMSNSRTGRYVQPSEVIDIKWPLLAKVLIALLALEIAGGHELAKHLDIKDFSTCLGYLLKHLKEICLYLYNEAYKWGEEKNESSLVFIRYELYLDLFQILYVGYVDLIESLEFTEDSNFKYKFEVIATDLVCFGYDFVSSLMNRLEDFSVESLCRVLYCFSVLCKTCPKRACVGIVMKRRMVLLDQAWIRSIYHKEMLLLLLNITSHVIRDDASVTEMTEIECSIVRSWILHGMDSMEPPIRVEAYKCIIYCKKIFDPIIHHSVLETRLIATLEKKKDGQAEKKLQTGCHIKASIMTDERQSEIEMLSFHNAVTVYMINCISIWNKKSQNQLHVSTPNSSRDRLVATTAAMYWEKIYYSCAKLEDSCLPRLMSFTELITAYCCLMRAKYRERREKDDPSKDPKFVEMLSELSLVISRLFNEFVMKTRNNELEAFNITTDSLLQCTLRGLLLITDIICEQSESSDLLHFSKIRENLKCLYIETSIDLYSSVVEYLLCLHETSRSKVVCEFTIVMVGEILFPQSGGNGYYTRITKEAADNVLLRLLKKFGRNDRKDDNNFSMDYTIIDLFSDLFARGVVSAYKTASLEGNLSVYTTFHFTKIISRLSNSNESIKQLLVQELEIFDALHNCMQTCLYNDGDFQRQYHKPKKDIVYSIMTACSACVTFLANHTLHVECAIESECVSDLILCLGNFEVDLITNRKSRNCIINKDSSCPSPVAVQGCVIGCFRALKSLSNYQVCVEYIQIIDKAELILCNAANRLHEVIADGKLVKEDEAKSIVLMMDELLGVTKELGVDPISATRRESQTQMQDNNSSSSVVNGDSNGDVYGDDSSQDSLSCIAS